MPVCCQHADAGMQWYAKRVARIRTVCLLAIFFFFLITFSTSFSETKLKNEGSEKTKVSSPASSVCVLLNRLLRCARTRWLRIPPVPRGADVWTPVCADRVAECTLQFLTILQKVWALQVCNVAASRSGLEYYLCSSSLCLWFYESYLVKS